MDNTELHYLTYDPDKIMEEMLIAYMDEGGDVLYPGDEKSMLLNTVLAVLVQAFAGVDNALRMGTLRYAVGEYLDLIGETRMCKRVEAAAAEAVIAITDDASGTPRVLDEGLSLVDNTGKLYVLSESVILPGNGVPVEANIVCSSVGSGGNDLKTGAEMRFLTPQIGVVHAECVVSATGGMDAEEDDAYRERIRLSGAANITTGTVLQYEALAKSVSSDIIDAQAVSGGAGIVNIYLLIADGADASAIIANVRNALDGNTSRPLTDSVNVLQAVTVDYALYVNCYVPVGTDITEAVNAAKDAYKEWQESEIACAFNPDKLMTLLYSAGCERVVIDSDRSYLGSGKAVYTEIGDGKICKGMIEITRTNA